MKTETYKYAESHSKQMIIREFLVFLMCDKGIRLSRKILEKLLPALSCNELSREVISDGEVSCLIHEFFKIDPEKLEEERIAMLGERKNQSWENQYMMRKVKKCPKCGGTAFEVSISDSCENCPENKDNQAEFTGECCMEIAFGVGCHIYKCLKCGQVEHWPTMDE